MSYYKIVVDNNVVDANCIFYRWQSRHRLMISCSPSQAQFISPRDCSAFWHPNWLNAVPEDSLYDGDIEAVEIEEEEYNALIAELDAGKTPTIADDPETENDASDDSETNDSSAPAIPVAGVKELLERIASLEESNRILTDCILEISSEVYG